MPDQKPREKWTDRWKGFYDACRKFYPELTMEDCARMADEYVGKRHISKVDKPSLRLTTQAQPLENVPVP